MYLLVICIYTMWTVNVCSIFSWQSYSGRSITVQNTGLDWPSKQYCLLRIQGKPGARGLPGPRGVPGLEVRPPDTVHMKKTRAKKALNFYGTKLLLAEGTFMSPNITCAKVNIFCFQGDEGPIGPAGLTGLEVSYYKYLVLPGWWKRAKRQQG